MQQNRLKFRAWYKDKFHYNIEKHHVEHHSMSGFSGEVWDFSDWLTYANVQQFTGLKDSKGNEIYEGDILNIFNHNQPELVEWEPHGSGFGFFKHDDSDRMDGNFEFLSHYTGSYGYEVIGNIFENPELLKQ